jgi:hypothetical protein
MKKTYLADASNFEPVARLFGTCWRPVPTLLSERRLKTLGFDQVAQVSKDYGVSRLRNA